MSMTLGTPTMTPDALTGRYVLSIKPTDPRPPRDGLERLERVLARPVWTQADRDRMKRASGGLEEHYAIRYGPCETDCRECALIDRINRQVKEWDRINQAPPIPSTAQLRNALRRPDREVRAVNLYRRLIERQSERAETVKAGVKQFKTEKVQYKHNSAAIAADPVMQRLRRAIDRLVIVQPDVRSLAHPRQRYY